MSQNLLDVAKLPVEMQKCNQPIFVARDVENIQIAHFIHRTKYIPQFCEAAEGGAFHCHAPCLQRTAGIVMDCRKLQQAAIGDDSHARRLLQNAMLVKLGLRHQWGDQLEIDCDADPASPWSHPALLMFDEPSMGLASLMVEKIFDTIRNISAQGVTILLVEQNTKLALEAAQRGYVLESGAITLSGGASELLGSDAVQRAYLGA